MNKNLTCVYFISFRYKHIRSVRNVKLSNFLITLISNKQLRMPHHTPTHFGSTFVYCICKVIIIGKLNNTWTLDPHIGLLNDSCRCTTYVKSPKCQLSTRLTNTLCSPNTNRGPNINNLVSRQIPTITLTTYSPF